ncbi:hypothetical protein AB0I81_17180 [Nonomuraea sp. NPDC050404]|uniref:hypothetical protein n=1 Tax=Nonomuraea sp. NPDC050404 TaxID=3155783 RepID=UPI0033D2B548
MASLTCRVAVLLMVVGAPPPVSRILATAASTTSRAPGGALSVTSTARSPETFPSLHTRAPSTTVPADADAPAEPLTGARFGARIGDCTATSARSAGAPVATDASPAPKDPATTAPGDWPASEDRATTAPGDWLASDAPGTAAADALPASQDPATAPPTGAPPAGAPPVAEAATGAPWDVTQATSVSASTGLAATATLAPLAMPFSRTRNRCMSPVLTHLPTPPAVFTRSRTSDTPTAATGTVGTAARISAPATIQPRRIAYISPTRDKLRTVIIVSQRGIS